jgi:G:T-mismatch repair DNA endonuclease (very short patch repair protein)
MKSKEAMRILQVSRDEFYYLVNVKKAIKIIEKNKKCYEYSDEDINTVSGTIKHRRTPRKQLTGRPCIICGHVFIPPIAFFNTPAYKGICCSRQCAAKYRKQRGDFEGASNSAWRGGPLKRICLVCGKEFMVKTKDLKKGHGKYCSRSCSMIHTHKAGKFNIKPNKPEKLLKRLFEKHYLPFTYTGGGDVWIGNHNPDFLNDNGKKQVIEFFGAYWHPHSDAAQWITHYKKYGFECLIIWEKEMSNMANVLEVVETYARNKAI